MAGKSTDRGLGTAFLITAVMITSSAAIQNLPNFFH